MRERTKQFLDWLDNRTGITHIVNEALYERIPGGPRWRYVWGSTLALAIITQFITGIVLVANYSANAQGAWESVFYIQNEMAAGWLLRGIHQYTAQVTVVLLGLHVLQVVIDGAYRAPREVNFWMGLALLFTILGLALTGYLLPWDQKGFWATKVATSIASITPVIGPQLQRMMVGGAEYGHHTLTRFLALHAGVFPALLTLLIIGHIYLFRRHGITAKDPDRGPDGMFFPDQLLKDAVAGLAVILIVVGLVLYTHGAELGAPADATEPYSAARPEWYFLFLFQWLKYFPTGTEVIGAMVIPGLIVTVIALMPIIARWRLGHRFNLVFMSSVAVAVVFLTFQARTEDGGDPDFQLAQENAQAEAERAKTLAEGLGIPPTGALTLLRNDPKTQGPKLFASNCASCHRFAGHDGLGAEPTDDQSASDLEGYGSREWLQGFFDPDRIGSADYFGETDHRRGEMARFVTRRVPRFSDADLAQLQNVIKAMSAQAELPYQARVDSTDAADIQVGLQAMTVEPTECSECHTVPGHVNDDPDGPTLVGWGSRAWMIDFVSNPEHPRYYGDDNDRMPSFLDEGILTRDQIGLIVDWIRQDWYRPAAEEQE
jgi:ubiquinol-cytochrome c reductase cytochrome b subunit